MCLNASSKGYACDLEIEVTANRRTGMLKCGLTNTDMH